VSDYRETLRKLTVGEDAFLERLFADETANAAESGLDAKTNALVRIAALIAVDAATSSYLEAVQAARAWSATDEEIVGCLVAVAPSVGVPRVVSAAPKVGLALGYDVEAALESRPRS
jgi:alkylhydroperoxidase/carboxymuconolactone decarboxylase family protein YurZ